jgi:hypothetical protein
MLAEKLRAMLRRVRARDLYDVWQLLTRHAETLDRERARHILEDKARYKGFSFSSVADFRLRTGGLGHGLGKRRCADRYPSWQSTVWSSLRSRVH